MGFFKRKKKEPALCPNCRKPVMDGTVFCDSCGLRLVPPPVCAKCQVPLAPDTNFCEACGTPVGSVPVPRGDLPAPDAKTPEPEKRERASKSKKLKNKKQNLVQNHEAVNPVITITEKSVPDEAPENPLPEVIPEEKKEDTNSLPAPQPVPRATASSGRPRVSRRILLISSILILGLILALAFMTGLLNINPGASQEARADPSGQNPAGSSEQTPMGTITLPWGQATYTTTFVPGSAQVLPEGLSVWFQAERDPITNRVTVTFDGGKGQRAVNKVLVRLTRSDGIILTQVFRTVTVGEGISLPGTKFSDRLEVIVSYNNGAQYTVIDKIFSYKIRN
jgi:hypothetical protein